MPRLSGQAAIEPDGRAAPEQYWAGAAGHWPLHVLRCLGRSCPLFGAVDVRKLTQRACIGDPDRRARKGKAPAHPLAPPPTAPCCALDRAARAALVVPRGWVRRHVARLVLSWTALSLILCLTRMLHHTHTPMQMVLVLHVLPPPRSPRSFRLSLPPCRISCRASPVC